MSIGCVFDSSPFQHVVLKRDSRVHAEHEHANIKFTRCIYIYDERLGAKLRVIESMRPL